MKTFLWRLDDEQDPFEEEVWYPPQEPLLDDTDESAHDHF